jgi:hypothetical protein
MLVVEVVVRIQAMVQQPLAAQAAVELVLFGQQLHQQELLISAEVVAVEAVVALAVLVL